MSFNTNRQEKQLAQLLNDINGKKEKLEFPMISVSEASRSLIDYTRNTKDYMIPSLWGNRPNDPFSPASNNFCQIL